MFRAILLSLSLFSFCASAADFSGEYIGTYTSAEGDAQGKLRMILKQNDDSTWNCRFFFTPETNEMATKTASCTLTANKLKAEFDAEAEGGAFHAILEGAADDTNTFEGTYKTAGADGDGGSHGKWKASPQH